MKREDVLSILENTEIDNSEKLSQILNLNGADINAQKKRIETLEEQKATLERDKSALETAAQAENDKYKDFDSIVQERDALKAEKEERAYSDRFNAVLGTNKPKNDFTHRGLLGRFKEEIAKEENKDKTDADIFKGIIEGHERDYFDSAVRITMTPANPNIKVPNADEAYLDEYYKDNPYYKKTT